MACLNVNSGIRVVYTKVSRFVIVFSKPRGLLGKLLDVSFILFVQQAAHRHPLRLLYVKLKSWNSALINALK